MRIYLNIEEFYEADSRRRTSGEVDYGVWWRDRGEILTYRISLVIDTGELYAICQPHGPVELLGQFTNRPECDETLQGWAQLCGLTGSLDWVRRRVLDHPAPTGAT